jgi:O-antigen/teichoic acid export membrane protein
MVRPVVSCVAIFSKTVANLSVKANILLNTVSQIYMALLSIVTLPFYIEVLGSPSYGLVAFFMQLQTLISLLDIGISATVSRNTALFRAGTIPRPDYLATIRSLECSFVVIGVLILLLSLTSPWIAVSWLNLGQYPVDTATHALQLIFVVIALRWMQTYYRAIVLGAEQLVWLGWFNIGISTVRILGVLPFLLLIDGGIIEFFLYQIAANFLELLMFYFRTNNIIGFAPGERFGAVNRNALQDAIRSSLVVGLTSLIWALITQADKFLASGMLLLADYTAYSLVISISSVLLLLSGTFIYAIGPTMARMIAQGERQAAIGIFRNTALAVSIVLGAASAVVMGWSEPLLFAWTGNQPLSAKAAEFLPLYMLAGLFFALGNLSYAINYALGDFSLRLRFSVMTLVAYVPVLFVLSTFVGEKGLVYSWFLINVLFFVLPQKRLYQQLDGQLYGLSLIKDVAIPVMLTMLILPIGYFVTLDQLSRSGILGCLFLLGVLSLSLGLIFSRARDLISAYLCRFKHSV